MADSKKPAKVEDPVPVEELSRDAANSTYKPHPSPNPDGLVPAPGPSTEQHLGKP